MHGVNGPHFGEGRVPEDLLIQAMAATSEISLIADADQKILHVSDSFVNITGYGREEALGRNCRMLQGPGTDPETTAAIRHALTAGTPFNGEILNYRKDGSAFWNALRITPLRSASGAVTHFVSVQRDINTRMALHEQLRFQALHDQVTGLPNRAAMGERIRLLLGSGTAGEHVPAIGLIDLDDFRDINNSYGHEAGDELLREWALRLQGLLRDGDVLGRMGGDEFLVIFRDIPPADADAAFRRLLEPLLEMAGTPFLVGGSDVTIGMSMGIALLPAEGADDADVLRAADEALYAVKQRKADRVQWWELGAAVGGEPDPDVTGDDGPVRPPEEIGRSYRRALDTGVVVHLQPVVDLRKGGVHLFEALARLELPGGRLAAPGEFLPHLDAADLDRLFSRVLDESLDRFSAWYRDGVCDGISVNLPPSVLLRPALVGDLASSLARHAVPAGCLTLELLESDSVDSEAQSEVLQEIAGLGVGVAMDDLGAGYSSLKRLSTLPFTTIKLDRDLLAGIHTRPTDALSMIATLIQMGRDFGMKVVIEGIEDRSVAEAVTVLGAALGQGYYFCRPIPAAEVPAFAGRFGEAFHPDLFRTHLGALAYHWQFARLGSPHPRELADCPLSHFLSAVGSPTDVERWHAQQHDGRAVHLGAGQLMVDWLVQQVRLTAEQVSALPVAGAS
ncbi:putative bifunctional diguanylate cyclase/phosphodiesterase [Arthrobacter sp. N1]|uniref:putative bifunctional diguanylate cyclase/phosphodiesterase n=1 Tax=Arthrobacter sp. N1 TaxID=619291 RepID=UPI003BAFB406